MPIRELAIISQTELESWPKPGEQYISNFGRPVHEGAGYLWPISEVVIQGCPVGTTDVHVMGGNFPYFDGNILFFW